MPAKTLIPAFAAFLIVALSHGAAPACALYADRGDPGVTGLDALPPGTFQGQFRCGALRMPVSVWTLEVDGTAERLGVRDDPLFRMPDANPLTQIARIGYDRTAHFTMFRRRLSAEPGAERAHRLFVTLCTDHAQPLDCSFGRHRVKMRVDLRDGNKDGRLDRAYHQISVYDGGDRLQVVYVDLPHDPRPHVMVGQLIRFLGETGMVDLERDL